MIFTEEAADQPRVTQLRTLLVTRASDISYKHQNQPVKASDTKENSEYISLYRYASVISAKVSRDPLG